MINCRLPKISCLLATKGRFERVKKAIRCYLRQTYPLRELVVISQGDHRQNEQIQSHLSSLGRNDIQFFSAPQKLTLGEVRNLSADLSRGSVLCQWDDDDLYHPNRLQSQYIALSSDDRNSVSAYSQFMKYFEKTAEVYWCDWWGERLHTNRFLSGSVMFYKKFFDEFPIFYPQEGYQSCFQEDWNALGKLASVGRIANVVSGHQYVYCYHGENVYGEDHHNLAIDTNSGKKVLSKSQLLDRRQSIEEIFASVDVAEIRIRSKEEIAFHV